MSLPEDERGRSSSKQGQVRTWSIVNQVPGPHRRFTRDLNSAGSSWRHQTVSTTENPERIGAFLGNLCLLSPFRASRIRQNGITDAIEEHQPSKGVRQSVASGAQWSVCRRESRYRYRHSTRSPSARRTHRDLVRCIQHCCWGRSGSTPTRNLETAELLEQATQQRTAQLLGHWSRTARRIIRGRQVPFIPWRSAYCGSDRPQASCWFRNQEGWHSASDPSALFTEDRPVCGPTTLHEGRTEWRRRCIVSCAIAEQSRNSNQRHRHMDVRAGWCRRHLTDRRVALCDTGRRSCWSDIITATETSTGHAQQAATGQLYNSKVLHMFIHKQYKHKQVNF